MADDDWTCKSCNREIDGKAIKVEGNRYHNDCFKCAKCGENFIETGNKNVTIQKGLAFFDDYLFILLLIEFFAYEFSINGRNRIFCAVCFVALDGAAHTDNTGPQRKRYVGQTVICDGCKEEITGKFTDFGSEEENNFRRYCNKCFTTSPPCAACGSPISKDPVFHPPLGHFHQNCYKCFRCGKEAEGDHNGRLVCGECHKKAFADTCEICRKFIMDESKAVFALKTRFHKECFVCDKCKTPLEDAVRFLVGGKLYCKSHKPN